MLLYFFQGKRTKYTLESIHFTAAINASVSPCLREELLWSRFVNTRGGSGNNIPTDLYMEHLNRTLKDYLRSNATEKTMLQMSKSLKGLTDITKHFDSICEVNPDSTHHTKHYTGKDEQMIIKKLTTETGIFDYVPGLHHKSFPAIKAHVASSVDMYDLIRTIKKHQTSIADYMDMKAIITQERLQE